MERIKIFLLNLLSVLFYPLIVIVIGTIVGLLTKSVENVIFTSFGLFVAYSLFLWGRQIWWFISGTGDYYGRIGALKKLWILIFKKKDNSPNDGDD